MNIRQGSSSLRLFSKKLRILIVLLGNTICDEYKDILIESKFPSEIINLVRGKYQNISTHELISKIVSELKQSKKSNSKSIKKCFKCKRRGHISKDCRFNSTIDGNELIPKFQKQKREEKKYEEGSLSPKRRRRYSDSDSE